MISTSSIEDAIDKIEKRKQKAGLTFDVRLKDLETMSIEQNERIAREALESGWKDEFRTMLGPLYEGLRRGEEAKGLVGVLMDVVADIIAWRATHPVSHHYLFRQIRLLEQRLEKLERQCVQRG